MLFMEKHIRLISIVLIGLTVSACGPSFKSSQSNQISSLDTTKTPLVPSPTAQTPQATVDISICSKLDFSDLNWSASLNSKLHTALALALNISGSFEGSNGWKNLTNNFDGQGWSYGLLNQCLGQGSLQPLLIDMRDEYPDQLQSLLSARNLAALKSMLIQWEGVSPLVAKASVEETNLADYGLSILDDAKEIDRLSESPGLSEKATAAVTRNQASVNWAVNTLYAGANFKSDWKSQLLNLAQSAGYRSLQVEAALKLHDSAFKLFAHFNLRELRSYLFFFDIVVQNGGLPAEDITALDRQFSQLPLRTETQKLNDILTLRLTHVKIAYREDVRARKSSLINGTGVVHGSSRNYNKEFCAKIEDQLSL